MPERWSVDRVLALAPDPGSARAARELARPGPWAHTGASADLVWGRCAGSGRQPYETVVDVSGPAYKCSCPSRKFPCKHALALLLIWAGGVVPDTAEPAGYATSWKQPRAARVAEKPRGPRDEQAAAKRAAQRADRVCAGLDELEMWLRDQVRAGLSAAAGSYRHAEPVAARMIDAQAPGVAAMLRRLSAVPASGDGWPARLLGGYGRLHLLARAHAQLEALPAEFAASVRAHVGYPVSRESVLAEPPVSDEWLVLGVRDLLDGAIPARRIWLRGRDSGRFAMVLTFDPRGEFTDVADNGFAPGSAVRADLHYYPGRPPLRVAVPEPPAEPVPASAPQARLTLAGQLREWAAVVELDPWLDDWPAVLRGVPVPGRPQWHFVEPEAGAVPLLTGGTDPWVLAAVSGGEPVVVAGEFSANGLRPLTVWHGDRAVRL